MVRDDEKQAETAEEQEVPVQDNAPQTEAPADEGERGGLFTEELAAICHNANATLCRVMGDNSQSDWEDAPDWQQASAINGVRFHLSHPNGAPPEAGHEAWMAQKVADGWQYGPIKDAHAKTHPCMVPFNELPRLQQAKDYLFRGIVIHLRHLIID